MNRIKNQLSHKKFRVKISVYIIMVKVQSHYDNIDEVIFIDNDGNTSLKLFGQRDSKYFCCCCLLIIGMLKRNDVILQFSEKLYVFDF